VTGTVWQRWRRFSHKAAAVQSHVVLFLLYFIAVVPLAFLSGLNRPRRRAVPEWTPSPADPARLDAARNQF
jgi:hypothetical protein